MKYYEAGAPDAIRGMTWFGPFVPPLSRMQQGAQRALEIDQRIAVASSGRHDPPDEEAVRANQLMMMQHAFHRPDGAVEQGHAEHALIPGRRREPFETLGAIAAGEMQGQVLLLAAEQADTKTAVGEDCVVGLPRSR